MQIAIITLPLLGNYGGILQNYALQKFSKRLGHSVETIRFPLELKLPLWKKPLSYGKRFIKKYILHENCRILYEKWYNSTQPILIKHLQNFIDEYIDYRNVNHLSEIKENDYDAFIVGSDQVWRPAYSLKPITNAYLSFAKNWKRVKRIAYAASFGTNEWEYTKSQTTSCESLAQLFDAISVREDASIDLCNHFLHTQAVHVLDPTMLLCSDDYIQLFKKISNAEPRGQLLTYILDDTAEKNQIVQKAARYYGLKLYQANSRYEDRSAPLNERIQPPIEQWLKDFYDARLVITDSFHATAFAILFEKPFIVLRNNLRGLSRIESLLKIFGLENHFVCSPDMINGHNYAYSSKEITPILQTWRKKSESFLINNLQ